MTDTSALSAVRRRWWIVVALAAIGALFGALPEPRRVEEQATSFTATHTMLANNVDAASVSSAAISPSQVTLLATTGEVPQRVAEQIAYSGNPAELAAQVDVLFDLSNGALTITTTQDTPERAQEIPDAFAEQLNAYLVERQDVVYQQRVAAVRSRLDELEAELNEITAQLAFAPDDAVLLAQRDAVARQYAVAFEQDRELVGTPAFLSFTTLQTAQPIAIVDRGLSAPTSRTTRAAMGLVAGAAVGVAVAVVLGRLDRKIRTREQAEALLGMRARVLIPRVGDPDRDSIVVSTGRYDSLSDAYRTLRNVVGVAFTSLEPESRARVTVVVSPGQGDGKTSLAANLAASFVETGHRTVAVNTDFRRPRLGSAVSDEPHSSVPTALEDIELLEPAALFTHTDQDDLVLLDLSMVDGTPGELVRVTARLVPRVAEISDSVVIDTSPVGATAEVLEMVPLADVIVLVVRLGHTQITAAERTIAILRELVTAPIVLALTGTKPTRERYAEYGQRPAQRERTAWPWSRARVDETVG